MTAQNRYVMTAATLEINGVDLSDLCRSVTVGQQAAEITSEAQGDTWQIRHAGGIKDASVTLEFYQSFAAGESYDTLKALLGELVTVKVSPHDGNDVWEAQASVLDLPFVDGTVFEAVTHSVTWPCSTPSVAPPPPSTPLWHTTLRVGAAGGDRGFDREGSNLWGRLTDDDVVIGSRTVTIWRLRVNGSSGNVQLGTDHRDDLDGKWLMVDGQVMEIDFGSATGNGQHTHTPGWSALTTGDLVAVSLWDRDPTGTSWTETTTPHKLWSTTMTAADASNTSGYNAVTAQGSLDDAEIATPDGDQTLSRFRWSGSALDARMATAVEAAPMFDLWFRFQVGDGTWVETQISDIVSTVLKLTPDPYTDDPNWLDGQAVTVEVWDQNPPN